MAAPDPTKMQQVPRPLDDLSIQPDIAEMPGDRERLREPQSIEQRFPDKEPADTKEERARREDLARRVKKFGLVLLKDLDSQLRRCSTAKQEALGVAGTFDDRMRRNTRRSRAQAEPDHDTRGTIDRTAEDGGYDIGLTMGWTRQGASTIASFLYRQLFESSTRSYAPKGRGNRQENRALERITTAIMDDQLNKAKSKAGTRLLSRKMPNEGTSILRMEMSHRAKFTQEIEVDAVTGDGKLAWRETEPDLVPSIKVWRLEDVYATHWDLPEASDQEGVFWVTRGVTLHDLERDEIVVAPNGLTGGKFRNIDIVREETATRRSVPGAGTDNPDRANMLPVRALVEYEGALPMLTYAKEGNVDWEVMQFFGVDVNMDPNPDDADAIEEWGRRLQRIPIWRVSWVTEISDRVTSDVTALKGHILLQAEPNRTRTPRNSMYVFRNQVDGQRLLGFSVADLGYRIEDSANTLLNAAILTAWKNAHPAVVYSTRALARKTKQEMERLFTEPDALVAMDGNVADINVKNLFDVVQLPVDRELLLKIQHLRFEFEQTTGAKAAAKGTDRASGTGTLGEIQRNAAISADDMMDVVFAAGREWARLITDLWQSLVWHMGPERFEEYAAEISGMGISKVQEVAPSLLGLDKELVFSHPVSASADKIVTASLLARLYAAYPMADWDVNGLARVSSELAGVQDTSPLFLSGSLMDPEDEQHQMSMGNWMEPDLRENVLEHVKTHAARQRELQSQGSPADLPEAEAMEMQLLAKHIVATVDMFEDFIQPQIDAAQQAAGQPGPAGAGGPSLGAASAATPQAPRKTAVSGAPTSPAGGQRVDADISRAAIMGAA